MKVEIFKTVDTDDMKLVRYYLFSHGSKEDQYGIEIANEEESIVVFEIDMRLENCIELFYRLVKNQCSPRHLKEVVRDFEIGLNEESDAQIYQQIVS